MRISDWSSDVCSSDLLHRFGSAGLLPDRTLVLMLPEEDAEKRAAARDGDAFDRFGARDREFHRKVANAFRSYAKQEPDRFRLIDASGAAGDVTPRLIDALSRSEEHTSELQSLMRISYAVFCLKKN